MAQLLDFVLDAHGGLENWKSVTGVDVRLTLGGVLFEIKQQPDGLRTALVKVNVRRPRTLITPFPEKGKRGIYQEGRVWIQTDAGDFVEELPTPRLLMKGMNVKRLGTISSISISSATPSGIISPRRSLLASDGTEERNLLFRLQ
jgi:hypothetical protein